MKLESIKRAENVNAATRRIPSGLVTRDMPLNLAIIGGGEGANKALESLRNNSLVTLKGVLCEAGELQGIIPHSCCRLSLDRILANPQIEAVYIATPNYTHVPLAQRCIRGGKHVLVEKPLAVSIPEARLLLEEKQFIVGVAFKKRFGDWVPHFQRLFLTKPADLRICAVWRIPPPRTLWRYSHRQSGGGALMDLGSHMLDLVEFLCGPILSISGMAVFDREFERIDRRSTIQLTLRSGAIANIILDWCGETASYRLEAKAGNHRFEHIRQFGEKDIIKISTNTETTTYHSDPSEEYHGLFRAFMQAIRGCPHALPQMSDGLHNLEMINVAYNSIQSDFLRTIRSDKNANVCPNLV
ncbi:MAG: Gfo/Idh/MocA family oxidoreductase [Opitutaceae bacterium]|jgi:predicted dehydrogenase